MSFLGLPLFSKRSHEARLVLSQPFLNFLPRVGAVSGFGFNDVLEEFVELFSVFGGDGYACLVEDFAQMPKVTCHKP